MAILTKEGDRIKTVSQLDSSTFDQSQKFVSIGHIRPDIVVEAINRFPEFNGILSPDTDIVFWADRIKHIERHKNDFSSEQEYERCLQNIPSIIAAPDYVSIHPSKDSISFIKDYDDHTSVAIRISLDGKLAFRTMYPLRDSQLNTYIRNGHAWECK